MTQRVIAVNLLRDSRVFVHTYTETVDGFRIIDGLPRVLGGIGDSIAVGDAVVAALRASNRRPLPSRNLRIHPPDRDLLQWLGLRSYGQFMRGVRSVQLIADFDEEIGDITVSPLRNGGKEGFMTIQGGAFTLSFDSPEQLGRAVQQAMGKATP